jgi:hypothetical protein
MGRSDDDGLGRHRRVAEYDGERRNPAQLIDPFEVHTCWFSSR